MPDTAGQVKRAWEKQLGSALRERGFRRVDADLHARPARPGSDNLVVRLRAAGRGETRVDVLDLGVGSTVHTAEQQAADLRGSAVNPHKLTLVKDLFDLASQQPGPEVTTRSDLVILSAEEVPGATDRVLQLIDDVAEPWLRQHHDPKTVLAELEGDRTAHQLRNLETMAVLALQVGDRDACVTLLTEHAAQLDRRGADLPAFAENRRWQAGLTSLLNDDA